MRKPVTKQIAVTDDEMHLITEALHDAADARARAVALAAEFMTPARRSDMEDKRVAVRALSSELWERWHAAERGKP